MKQRFGEALALVLIAAIVGFLVYMMLPVHSNPPKSSPVTVRSTATLEEKPQAVMLSYQTPTSDQVPQGEIVAVNTSTQVTPKSHDFKASSSFSGNELQSGKNEVRQPISDATKVVAVGEIKTTVCTSLSKSVAKVGVVLHDLPVVGGLVSGATDCSS